MELDIIETMRVKPKPVQQSQRATEWAWVVVKAGGETILDSRRYE